MIIEFDLLAASRKVRVTGITSNRQTSLEPAERQALRAHLQGLAVSIWGLDDNLRECYRTLRTDPVLVPLLRRMADCGSYGLRTSMKRW